MVIPITSGSFASPSFLPPQSAQKRRGLGARVLRQSGLLKMTGSYTEVIKAALPLKFATAKIPLDFLVYGVYIHCTLCF